MLTLIYVQLISEARGHLRLTRKQEAAAGGYAEPLRRPDDAANKKSGICTNGADTASKARWEKLI